MRILLDECIPKQFGRFLKGHSFSTVGQAGWAGIKNGKLLKLAQEQFQAFITVDQNLRFQQNFDQLSITVIVLQAHSNALEDLVPFLPKLLAVLSEPLPGNAIVLGP